MYTPSETILKKYADVFVKFALRGGKGVNPGDVIFVQIPECAKAMYLPLQKSILEAGAHPIFEYLPDGVAKHFYEHASDEQISFYPSHFLHGKVEQMTHVLSVIAEDDMQELKDIDPKKIAARISSRKEYRERRIQKEMEGKHSRTLGLFGTEAMAKEAHMSLEDYRQEIIQACYLDQEDPIARWQETLDAIETIKTKLDELPIEYLHIVGPDADLTLRL